MKQFLWWVSLFVAFLAAFGAVLHYGKQAEPFPPGSQSEALLQPGPMSVQKYAEIFIDDSRPTGANGDYSGAAARHLNGMVWHPTSDSNAPYPLVIYSHGFTSNWSEGVYLAEQLTSLGYVVVAFNYPLTTFQAPGGPNVKDVVNQPGDVSFIIDRLLQQSNTTGHALEGMIDVARIGVMGISLGGMTSELLGFHPEMRDPRIGAVLSIAGPTAIFTKKFFDDASVPFLMVAGSIDALVPYASNAAPITAKVPGSQLVTLAGGSHTGFAGSAAPLRWLNNPDALGCFMVTRNIGTASDDSWFELIGTQEQGIDYNAKNDLCVMDPLPEAMNALRQQMITLVATSSFFQSIFAREAGQREAARIYLRETMARELPDVSFQKSTQDQTD